MIRLESLILRTCERKALSDRDSCVCTGKYARNPLAIVHSLQLACMAQRVNQRSRNKILPRSAQILFVTGMAVAMLVNARSSNHKPNH